MLLFLIIYVVGFVLSYGLVFNYLQYPHSYISSIMYQEDMIFTLLVSLIWYFSVWIFLLISVVEGIPLGFKWK